MTTDICQSSSGKNVLTGAQIVRQGAEGLPDNLSGTPEMISAFTAIVEIISQNSTVLVKSFAHLNRSFFSSLPGGGRR